MNEYINGLPASEIDARMQEVSERLEAGEYDEPDSRTEEGLMPLSEVVAFFCRSFDYSRTSFYRAHRRLLEAHWYGTWERNGGYRPSVKRIHEADVVQLINNLKQEAISDTEWKQKHAA